MPPSKSSTLTLNVLRQELRTALDSHGDRLMMRIRQEVNLNVGGANIETDYGLEVIPEQSMARENGVAVERHPVIREPSVKEHVTIAEPDEDDNTDSAVIAIQSTRRQASSTKPHQWILRNPTYMAPVESEEPMVVKRSVRAYHTQARTTPRPQTLRNSRNTAVKRQVTTRTSGSRVTNRQTPPVRFMTGFHEPGSAGDAGDSTGATLSLMDSPQGSDDDETPAEEIPQKAEERLSLPTRTTEYFEEEMSNPILAADYPRFRMTRWCIRHWLKSSVESGFFEYTCGIFVVLNAASLGVETNFQVTHRNTPLPSIFGVIEALFCCLFTLEQAMRLCVYRRRFFTMKGRHWNIFDFSVVSLQLFEQISHLFAILTGNLDLSVVRMLRVLRLVRITRLIRVLRMVHELRTLVASIMGSFKSLGWTLLLLMIVIYTFSVLFTQIVLDRLKSDPPHADALHRWFGSLARTALTLFESILGGVSWEEVVMPLSADISPMVVVVFCFYLAFCVFALMNVVTGEFVEKAMQTAQDHKDMYLANRISEIFFNEGDQITWEVFARKMDNPDMREYFKAINVDPSEAFGLFKLLDADGSGDIDCEEIVNGLLRLRGSARALELSLLTSETMRIHQTLNKSMEELDRRLLAITRLVAKAKVNIPEDRKESVVQASPTLVTALGRGRAMSHLSAVSLHSEQ